MIAPAFLILALLRSPEGTPPASAPSTRPAEVTSTLADLWRDRDYFYLRVDGHASKTPGFAPAGATELGIKVTSLARGRPWPGRWTALDVEMRPEVDEDVAVSFVADDASPKEMPSPVRVRLAKGAWTAPRLLLPKTPHDVRIVIAGGLKGQLEFRHVRLIDDRVVLWSEGWEVRREAGQIVITFPDRRGMTLSGNCELLEVNALRAVVRRGGESGAVYRTGRACAGEPNAPHLTLASATDDVRLDRTTEGDPDGRGYNAFLGATILQASSRHFRLTLAPESPAPSVPLPAIELRSLPPGPITALWDGKPLPSVVRLGDGTALVQIPADVRSATTLEITVGN